MGIQAQVEQAYKDAFRKGSKSEVLVYRSLKSAMKNEEIALRTTTLTDDQSVSVLQREAKQRRDAIGLYQQGNRAELAATEQAELEVILRFLPAELTDEELAGLVKAAIAETGATSLANQGKVMSAVMPKVSGRADGSRVAALVKQLLSG